MAYSDLYKKGDSIELEKQVWVEIVFISKNLVQVEYDDMTRRLLDLSKYNITGFKEENYGKRTNN